VDQRIAQFVTAESCEQFALNVQDREPEAASEARRRAVELRAAAHGATTAAERESLEAVYAYEAARSVGRNRRFRASRTWQMIRERGILPAVENVVARPRDSAGYRALVEAGMLDKAFEAVVLRHPEAFSTDAVERSKKRMAGGHPDSDGEAR